MKVLVLVKANPDSEAGAPPDGALLAAMMKFNEELMKAGVLLDLGGLTPSAKGARVRFAGASRSVVDGPFAESKELVAGYWLLQVKSLAEAIEWMKRCPNPTGADGELELRPLTDVGDFPEATAETLAAAARIGEQLGR
ncbi:MAG TPA: YciI family protein [Kofleriaceae bacterium]|nr:YciI family protein [Kofleriaceae bacterium]